MAMGELHTDRLCKKKGGPAQGKLIRLKDKRGPADWGPEKGGDERSNRTRTPKNRIRQEKENRPKNQSGVGPHTKAKRENLEKKTRPSHHKQGREGGELDVCEHLFRHAGQGGHQNSKHTLPK